ncbi:hypothetical protein EVAR_23679_1 [Eumeta japonica]|uniref:Uncharacterized protein n=1 Tax=Eumeta variegata TaxID=151549 RepID=A0A4C1VIJ3_EUMVA|nr:hypothetical protein EVAR_23679_1 [Eumeta japonica]
MSHEARLSATFLGRFLRVPKRLSRAVCSRGDFPRKDIKSTGEGRLARSRYLDKGPPRPPPSARAIGGPVRSSNVVSYLTSWTALKYPSRYTK